MTGLLGHFAVVSDDQPSRQAARLIEGDLRHGFLARGLGLFDQCRV
jgi:hypothetical protein